MPDFELRADYDHDGRLTGSQTEYDARQTVPGAILVANVDADNRNLPVSVTAGPPIRLDYTNYTPSAADDEFVAIKVKINNASASAGRQFVLRVNPGIHAVRLSFFDDSGQILRTPRSNVPGEHPITLPSAPELTLSMQSRAYPGSPYGYATLLTTTYDPQSDTEDQSSFTLDLISRDASHQEVLHDTGRFSIAPVLFLDNGVRAVRLYICERPDTLAALTDVRAAMRSIPGLALVVVPLDASGSDTWLQDQFQPGIVVGGDTWRHAIIHMPRMRSDFVSRRTTDNLASFVTSHFPARNVGLMGDFWNRTISFSDANGVMKTISFAECVALGTNMEDVYTILDYIDRIATSVDSHSPRHIGLGWTDARTVLREALADVRRSTTSATVSDEWRAVLNAQLTDVETRINTIERTMPVNSATTVFTLPVATQTMDVSSDLADELYPRVAQMQRSANYGGNVESVPPSPGAPLGTIVLGNARIGGTFDHMDPDVRRFFFRQKQFVFEVDTTWLDVGHVDEMLTFVPDANGSGQRFAALRASSGLAMSIVREALRKYLSGLSINHPHRNLNLHLLTLAYRLTNTGQFPVTRLMRGKLWSNVHPRPGTGGMIPDILEPPRIYQALARDYNGGDLTGPQGHVGLTTHGIRYLPGPGDDRFYPADITALELNLVEADRRTDSVNDFIETTWLAPLDDAIGRRFGNPRIFPMPVVFDRIDDISEWEENRWSFSTSAFTPDTVNLQVLNNHVLIPRPYGPRMRPDDATVVLTTVLQDFPWGNALARQLNARFYRRFGLDVTICWMERHNHFSRGATVIFEGLENLDQVANAFEDGFPGLSHLDIKARILPDNRRNFNPDETLRTGWRQFLINEGMVDLFEAYIQLVAGALGLTVHFVDSWFYHVHFGGIHCGTNVLREPNRGQVRNWWTV
jgi:hypothetical protein